MRVFYDRGCVSSSPALLQEMSVCKAYLRVRENVSTLCVISLSCITSRYELKRHCSAFGTIFHVQVFSSSRSKRIRFITSKDEEMSHITNSLYRRNVYLTCFLLASQCSVLPWRCHWPFLWHQFYKKHRQLFEACKYFSYMFWVAECDEYEHWGLVEL